MVHAITEFIKGGNQWLINLPVQFSESSAVGAMGFGWATRGFKKGKRAMLKLIGRFAGDESGATAIEYGLIVALIAVVIITAVATLGNHLNNAFGDINSNLSNV